jgi:hypothetical protein
MPNPNEWSTCLAETTAGFRPYVNAVDATFGNEWDYAMLVKVHRGDENNRERYSPSEIAEARDDPNDQHSNKREEDMARPIR